MTTALLMPEKRSKIPSRILEDFIEERLEGAGETFLVSFLDGYLYYAPLSNVSMLLDEFGASTVRKYFRQETLLPNEQSLIDDLVKRKVFKISGTQQRSLTQPSMRWAPTSATFSNTQKCTLRCTYCYAEGGRLEDLDIPLSVAKGAIDLIVKNAHVQKVDPSIRFLGEGEATASWGVFREIIEYYKKQCKANDFKPSISLSTNGVFSQSRLDYIAENCTHLTFSLDGVREVHDEHRVLPNGGGSFDRIIATMKEIEMRGKAYDIRSTVTVAGSSTLSEFVAFVGENLQCKSLHFEPVFDATKVTNLKDQIEHLDGQIFVDHFREASRVAAGFGIQLHYSAASLKVAEPARRSTMAS